MAKRLLVLLGVISLVLLNVVPALTQDAPAVPIDLCNGNIEDGTVNVYVEGDDNMHTYFNENGILLYSEGYDVDRELSIAEAVSNTARAGFLMIGDLDAMVFAHRVPSLAKLQESVRAENSVIGVPYDFTWVGSSIFNGFYDPGTHLLWPNEAEVAEMANMVKRTDDEVDQIRRELAETVLWSHDTFTAGTTTLTSTDADVLAEQIRVAPVAEIIQLLENMLPEDQITIYMVAQQPGTPTVRQVFNAWAKIREDDCLPR